MTELTLPYSEDRTEVHDPYFRVQIADVPLPDHLKVLDASYEEEEGKRATATLRVLDPTATFYAAPFVKRRDLVVMWFGYFREHEKRGPFRVQEVRGRFDGAEIEVEIELAELGDGFRGQVRCRTFTNGSLGDVLERVATQAGLQWRPERLSAEILSTPVTADRAWVQNNESDGAFMRRISQAHGLRLTIADGRAGAAPPSSRTQTPPLLLKYYTEDASMKNVVVESKSRRPPSTRTDRANEEEPPQVCLDETFQLAEDFAPFGPSELEFEVPGVLELLGVELPESAQSIVDSISESEAVTSVTAELEAVFSNLGPSVEFDTVTSSIPVVDLGGLMMSTDARPNVPAADSEGFVRLDVSPDPAFVQGRMSVEADAPAQRFESVVRMDREGSVRYETRIVEGGSGSQKGEQDVPTYLRSPNWDERGGYGRETPGRAEGANGTDASDSTRLDGVAASRGSTSYTIHFDMPFGSVRVRPRMPVVVQGLGPVLSGSGYRVTSVSLDYSTMGGFDTSVTIERTLPFILEGARRRRESAPDVEAPELDAEGFSPAEDLGPEEQTTPSVETRVRMDRMGNLSERRIEDEGGS
jgi:hypothetical protein